MKYLILVTLMLFAIVGCFEDSGTYTSNCPTTAACGCSGHNKSECELDSCCRWIVGDGCDCR